MEMEEEKAAEMDIPDERDERTVLIDRIAEICTNSTALDSGSGFDKMWNDMTIEQLRTVVIILKDDVVSVLRAEKGPKGKCHLLQALYGWTTGNTHTVSDRQRGQINEMYESTKM